MKIINFAFIFVLIFCCFALPMDSTINTIEAISEKKILYDQLLESAIDDAAMNLVEVDSKRELSINKESCVQTFFQSLYFNFGITTNHYLQQNLNQYIPIILITKEDGYYINYCMKKVIEGIPLLTRQWTEKKHYTYETNTMIVLFTFNYNLKLYDKKENIWLEGTYEDLKQYYTHEVIFQNTFYYDALRRQVIIDELKKTMSYYINRHNLIAKQFGITYSFSLPYIEREEWNRTIDDITLFVLFQGYPFGNGESYNRFAFAGARIRKLDNEKTSRMAEQAENK